MLSTPYMRPGCILLEIWRCCVNAAHAPGGVPDVRLEEAVEWLLDNVQVSEFSQRNVGFVLLGSIGPLRKADGDSFET